MEFINRNQEIVEEIDQGATYALVAQKYGLSRQTIRTIFLDVKEKQENITNFFN